MSPFGSGGRSRSTLSKPLKLSRGVGGTAAPPTDWRAGSGRRTSGPGWLRCVSGPGDGASDMMGRGGRTGIERRGREASCRLALSTTGPGLLAPVCAAARSEIPSVRLATKTASTDRRDKKAVARVLRVPRMPLCCCRTTAQRPRNRRRCCGRHHNLPRKGFHRLCRRQNGSHPGKGAHCERRPQSAGNEATLTAFPPASICSRWTRLTRPGPKSRTQTVQSTTGFRAT